MKINQGAMNKNELAQKLESSEATKSLLFENKVSEILKENNWHTIHSPYFSDINTNKLREIDLIGRMDFEDTSENSSKIISSIDLVIECKTISNYHILCSDELNVDKYDKDRNDNFWIGNDTYNRYSKLISLLNKTKLSEHQKNIVLGLFESYLYKDGIAVVGDYIPKTFSKIKRFSTYRETNIASSKELDNSVLWKAFSALNSACESYKSFVWNNWEDDVLAYIDYVLTLNEGTTNRLNDLFKDDYHKHISLHKILVLDSNIWATTTPLEPIGSFRFLQRSMFGNVENWMDVVNINYFDEYCTQITKHYNDFFQEQNMNRYK